MAEVVEAVGKPCRGGPIVIICRGSEGIQSGTIARGDHLLPVVDEPIDRPLSVIEANGKALA